MATWIPILLKDFFTRKTRLKPFLHGFEMVQKCYQQTFTSSKSTIETLKKVVKSVQSTQQTPEQRHWRLSNAFNVNFEQISKLLLVFLLLTLNRWIFAKLWWLLGFLHQILLPVSRVLNIFWMSYLNSIYVLGPGS